jgi:hypothetical protein
MKQKDQFKEKKNNYLSGHGSLTRSSHVTAFERAAFSEIVRYQHLELVTASKICTKKKKNHLKI